jgi:hypothetical protein
VIEIAHETNTGLIIRWLIILAPTDGWVHFAYMLYKHLLHDVFLNLSYLRWVEHTQAASFYHRWPADANVGSLSTSLRGSDHGREGGRDKRDIKSRNRQA